MYQTRSQLMAKWEQMGILSAHARLGVFLWVYPLVCPGAAYYKYYRKSQEEQEVPDKIWRSSFVRQKYKYRNGSEPFCSEPLIKLY